MKILLALAAAAAGAALMLAVAATGGSSSGRTLYVIEHATTDAVTDTGASGDSVGDILTFHNEVYDKTDASYSGHDQGMCIRTIKGAAWECWWTVFLAGGQITVEGPFYDTRNSRFAVTGGTGVYAGASGWMELKFRAGGTKFDFIYHLS